MKNFDKEVIDDFGYEWSKFNQQNLDPAIQVKIFEDYFKIFPWEAIGSSAIGLDIGCGSGRWAQLVSKRVGFLHLLDPSEMALNVAKTNMCGQDNILFHLASVGNLPFEESTLDFAYSLGVLHHIPDTFSGICSIGRVLKPGAPFLIYLYYAFDNRPWWFRYLWLTSNILRKLISRLPIRIKMCVCELISLLIYFPLARLAKALHFIGHLPLNWPLSYYKDCDYYVMRTDALDRFGTKLEKRYTKENIENMLKSAGFENITFSPSSPYWCAVGYKSMPSYKY